MLGFLSFLAVLSGIAFVVAALLLLARLIQKKQKKLPAIVSAVSLIAFCALSVWVSEIYVPTEKPAQDSRQGIAESGKPADTEKQVKETESKKNADKPEEEPGTAVPETETKTASAKPGKPSGAAPAKDNADSKPPSTKQPEPKPKDKASEKPPIQKEPEKAGQTEPETDSTETTKDNPLYAAEINTADVMSGSGNNKVGERAWITMPKKTMLSLSEKDFLDYAENVVTKQYGSYNWFSIFMDDGTGIIFYASNYSCFDYGIMENEGRIETLICGASISLDDNSYEFYSAEEYYSAE